MKLRNKLFLLFFCLPFACIAKTYNLTIAESLFHGKASQLYLSKLTGGQCGLPGVYHIKSHACVPLRKEWLCGLHMLYNMCVVENTAQISWVNEEDYLRQCYKVPRVLDERGSYHSDLKKVAKNLVQSPFYILDYDCTYEAVEVEGYKNEKKFWNKVKKELLKSGNRCVHFGCRIDADPNEPHIFLISVVKTQNDTLSMYILDSENDLADEPSQQCMAQHVLFIYNNLFSYN